MQRTKKKMITLTQKQCVKWDHQVKVISAVESSKGPKMQSYIKSCFYMKTAEK